MDFYDVQTGHSYMVAMAVIHPMKHGLIQHSPRTEDDQINITPCGYLLRMD